MQDDKWYLKDSKEVIKALNSNINGLSSKEAKKRQKQYGLNVLPKKKSDSIFKILFRQLTDPIVLLLVITVVFSFIIGEIVDACAIIFIILVDLILGTFQEWKAEKTAESLQNLIKDRVIVLRDNEEVEIDSSEVTIGDIVLLESGDQVSADLRLIETHNLQIDEAVLTGESVSVTKTTAKLEGETGLSDQKTWFLLVLQL